MKDAYSYAVHNNTAGAVVNKLFHKAFSVAKRVRTETRIGASAVSISYAAVELAKRYSGIWRVKRDAHRSRRDGRACREAPLEFGVRDIVVTNRTFERAVELAREFNGTPVVFREFEHHLKNVDIVIASTGSPTFIIKPGARYRSNERAQAQAHVFMDISVPRNIDPSVNNIDNAYVYDIDSLQDVVEANIKEEVKGGRGARGDSRL